MGTLSYAILGLLNRKSMTGYEMAKEFETTLLELWNAKHSQIYPTLKKLTEAGLITYKIEVTGTVLEKKLYSITPDGERAFQDWMKEDFAISNIPKDEFRLRLFFSDTISATDRIALLKDQLTKHQKRLAHLHENLSKFDICPPDRDDLFSDYLVLMGGIMREENTCNWLTMCIELCQNREEKK